MASQMLPQADDASFDQLVLAQSSPVLVEFFAPWCPHCRRMAPTIEELAKAYEGRLRVIQVNADANGNSALLQRYGIRGVPTIVLFAGGKEIDRMVGAAAREQVAARIDQVLTRVPQPG